MTTTAIDIELATPAGCWHFAGRLDAMSRPEITALWELLTLTATELRQVEMTEAAADDADPRRTQDPAEVDPRRDPEVAEDRGQWFRRGAA